MNKNIAAALDRMDALIAPGNSLLAVSDTSATAEGARADMARIRAALEASRPAIDWSQAGLLMEAHATTRQFITGTTNWAAAICKYMTERASHGQAPAGADWWRKRADEIEARVAATGSQEAMRCYTDMRTLLQAATAQPAPAATKGDSHG